MSGASCSMQLSSSHGSALAQAVTGVRLRATKPRYTAATFPDNGHHALWVGRSGDVWFDT